MNEKDIKKELKYKYDIKKEELINRIYKDFRGDFINIIEKNIYLLGKYTIMDINLVRKLIEKYGDNKENDIILFTIIFTLNFEKEQGNVFTYRKELQKRVNKEANTNISEQQLDDNLKFLEKENLIKVEKLNTIYIKSLYDSEVELSNRIRELIKDNNGIFKDKEIDEFLEGYKKLDISKQKDAIKICLRHKISILTGMAGTGKTVTLKVIVEGIKKFMPDAIIKLTSLSGKAVRRAVEVVGIEGQTMHSLLKIKENEDIINRKVTKIDADVLIIDESSMIDIELFNLLFKSINENCIVIMAGDYRQLPAIGSGSVFKDLIESMVLPVAELNEIIRQGSDNIIIENSHMIVSGIGFSEEKGTGLRIKPGEFEFIQCNVKEIKNETINVINMNLNKGEDFYNIQVIAPQRKGENGIDEINYNIATNFNNSIGRERNKFYVMDSVVQMTNDYTKAIYNGEIGIVTRIESDNFMGIDKMNVKFDDREVEYIREEVGDLELSFCLTVHKMQGSESKIVIFVVDKSCKNLSRELLYTAITRATDKIVIIGDKDAFNNGLEKSSTKRNSMLVERIQDSMKTKE
ncbi:AAA family ATPase [Clostridium chromiireducens]|uniref:AAA family ATPase n=1 Tax=Clostridium chromiireducens TaxID=225345 RepID=A0A964RML3_9CLOT|nr:AAA family ATPase [Clostridium chromiireducens]MVX64398.1 AAA family ATPase [Clostridium chromiireducens]